MRWRVRIFRPSSGASFARQRASAAFSRCSSCCSRCAKYAASFASSAESRPAIGAVKSAGYGEVVKPAVTLSKSTAVVIPTGANAVARRRYRVTFDRPILVDAEWIADNAMAGSAIVPGAVFKGALAQMLTYAGEDPRKGDYSGPLSAISFSHAFPEAEDIPGEAAQTI